MSKTKPSVSLRYRLQRCVFRFIGNIKWSGIKRPFWFTFNAEGYKLKGEDYRAVKKLIRPGDILIRRFEGYIDKWFIPGFWNHAGIFIGDDGDKVAQVIHAVSEGVVQEYLLDFMRTDHMMILRLSSEFPRLAEARAIGSARSILGKPYDFGFDFGNADRFSCTELVDYCYPGLAKKKKRFGKKIIVADDFVGSDKLTVVWDSRDMEASSDA